MFGWSKKTAKPSTDPLKSDRYKGKPLLILLENYVLDAIGELPKEKQDSIKTVVQRVYGGGDNWKATLRSTLVLEDTVDEEFKRLWVRNQEIARQAGQVLSPAEFARMIVDKNFSDWEGRT